MLFSEILFRYNTKLFSIKLNNIGIDVQNLSMWFAIEDEKCIQIQKNFHGWKAKKSEYGSPEFNQGR